jgi:hypothetical protein
MAMLKGNQAANGFKGIYTQASDRAMAIGMAAPFAIGTIGNLYGGYKGHQNSPEHPFWGTIGGMTAGGDIGFGLGSVGVGAAMLASKKHFGTGFSPMGHLGMGAAFAGIGALFGMAAW